jgi:drug/metabolite transporter (DMT)-like permease
LTKGNFSQIQLSNLKVDLIVLGAAGVFGLFSVLSKKTDMEPFTATTLFFAAGTFFSFFAMLFFSHWGVPAKESFWPILGNGILINGLSYIFWLKGLKYAKASFVAPFVFRTPVIAAVLIVLFFKEVFLPIYILGLGLVITAGLISK